MVLISAFTSRESADQTFGGQPTHWLELSRNGTERVTKGWRDTRMISNALRIICNLVMLETKSSECKVGTTPQTRDFAGDLTGSTCKKQTAVSHSSTEAEVMSFDTGLRMEGSPPLTCAITDVLDLLPLEQGVTLQTRNTDSRTRNRQFVFHQMHQSPAIALTLLILRIMRL